MKDIPLDPLLATGTLRHDIDGFNSTFALDDGSNNLYVVDKLRARHMEMLSQYRNLSKFAVDDDLLWPDGHLIRRLSFYEALDHVRSGKGYTIEPQVACFFDYSSRQVLNQNFLRFCSIWPLVLQARDYSFWSAILSVIIVLMDLLSFWANKVWKFVQQWLSRLVKWIIAQFSNRETRLFLHTFMSTISRQFECHNFVTQQSSLKKLQKFAVMTNIRMDAQRIQTFHGIPCCYGPWRRNENAILVNGVPYDVQIDREYLSGGDNSFVRIQGTSGPFVKEKGWTTEDMAYFCEICQVCENAGAAPIKTLFDHEGHCCTFQEFVEGVKTRKFLVCELKKEELLYIS